MQSNLDLQSVEHRPAGGAVRSEWELREQLVHVLEAAAAGSADASEAAALLEQLRAVWVRERRWRNTSAPKPAVVHVASPVINCREARPSCPGYIVDRRQTCQVCGQQLVRGRWALFFDEGQRVAVYGARAPITYAATGHEAEVPCSGAPV
jgi:hypothetical protein